MKNRLALVGMICGLALLLSSCEKELPPPSGGEEVTINFSLESFTFGESETVTRGSGQIEPETVIVPVGDDGLCMVATMAPDPAIATRGAINIAIDTEIRVVAYVSGAFVSQATYKVGAGGSLTATTAFSPAIVTGTTYEFVAYASNKQTALPTPLTDFNPATVDVLWGKTAPIAVTANLGNVTIQIRHLCSQVTTVLKNDQNHLFGGTITVSIPGNHVNLSNVQIQPAAAAAATYSFPTTWASSGSPSGSIRTSDPILVFTNSAATTTVEIASGMTINSAAIGAQTIQFNNAELEPNKSYILTVEFKRFHAYGRVTAFTNVMYDFQHQTLTSYVTSGAAPAGWQWQVSTSRNGSYVNIPGAVSATYTVPANFIHNYSTLAPGITGTPTDDELFFKCVLNNGVITDANALGIMFIRTTDGSGNFLAGYGIDNGVRYLTMNRAINTPSGSSSNTIKVALLNVGATDNDGIGLGDMYQWGRIKDGHEKIGWIKRTDVASSSSQYMANVFDAVTAANRVHLDDRLNGSVSGAHTSGGQIPNDGALGFGKFIFIPSGGNWGDGSIELWGSAFGTRALSPVNFSDWSPPPLGQANNPCPSDWYVPSRWDWNDMNNGDGQNPNPSSISSMPYTGNNNEWEYRAAQNYAIGGGVLTNKLNQGKLFLPAAGARNFVDGIATSIGSGGYYWGSTFGVVVTSTTSSYSLSFGIGGVYAGIGTISRANGYSVRCVNGSEFTVKGIPYDDGGDASGERWITW